ncbi:MAG: hypothetical protein IGS50_10605 [Synechococcales cyanobacterium C42_A2020_086]|jgi:hypothetical protein|nr:hypothetical protein [Synechococcales cyanobacterium C42_A2020_086]
MNPDPEPALTPSDLPPDSSQLDSQMIRDAIAQQLHDFWLAQYRAYCTGQSSPEMLWAEYRLDSLEQVPPAVSAAYEFYDQEVAQADWGSVAVYQPTLAGQSVYVVQVTTDGDDGWLEVYDSAGNLLGAARRYIELLAWGKVDCLRKQVQTGEFPPELDFNASLWGQPLPE